MKSHWIPLVLLLAATACASPPAVENTSPLAGTAWELHAIQSMDDAQGTTRIATPERYTVRFAADGDASFRLDCNRATGTWQATAAGNNSGSLSFGPIAATRAMCPPPHLDQRIVRDLAYVRGYVLADGKLFMSLMADAGIYEWHPHREPSER